MENLNEEFSQELSDLKWQFENMQQIFSNLESTISEAKGESEEEPNSENQQQKSSKSREDNKPKEDNKQNKTSKIDQGTQQLCSQIQDFAKQTQSQQTNIQQELQKSIQQAIDILNQANMQIQTNQALLMMNQFISQAEQQINLITQGNKGGDNSKKQQRQLH